MLMRFVLAVNVSTHQMHTPTDVASFRIIRMNTEFSHFRINLFESSMWVPEFGRVWIEVPDVEILDAIFLIKKM